MNKKTCIIYNSWSDMIRDLPAEMAGQLMQAILAYAFDDEEIVLEDPALSSMLKMIKKKLDEDSRSYEKKVERVNDAREKRQQKSDNFQTENRLKSECNQTENRLKSDSNQTENRLKSDSNQTEVNSVSDSVSVSVSDNKKERGSAPRFSPPSVEDVRLYCQERHNGIDPNAFVDFYASKGWKIGKETMKDWKAAVRTWERRETSVPETARSGTKKQENFPQREYDFEALERQLIRNY